MQGGCCSWWNKDAKAKGNVTPRTVKKFVTQKSERKIIHVAQNKTNLERKQSRTDSPIHHRSEAKDVKNDSGATTARSDTNNQPQSQPQSPNLPGSVIISSTQNNSSPYPN